jgi:predicted small secreted protein
LGLALSPLLRIPSALALLPVRHKLGSGVPFFRAESQDERALLTVGRRDKLELDPAGHPDAASETIEVISEIPEHGIVRKTKAYGLRTPLHRLLTIIFSVRCDIQRWNVRMSSFRSCRFSFALPTFLRTQSKPMELPMRKTLAILVLNLFLLSSATALLGACNTAAGVGEDISATGNAITGGADQSRPH